MTNEEAEAKAREIIRAWQANPGIAGSPDLIERITQALIEAGTRAEVPTDEEWEGLYLSTFLDGEYSKGHNQAINSVRDWFRYRMKSRPPAPKPVAVSDDEINEASGVRHGLGGDFVEGFILGAKWMRDKLAQPQSNKADG